MRSIGLPLLAAALLVGAAPGNAAAAHAPAVKVADCRTGKLPEARLATFEGRMRVVKGAARMAMRFSLRQTTPGALTAQPVVARDLSLWRRSRSGVKEFTYAQTVKGLESGVTYSTMVQFRWYDAKGRVMRRAERESGTCTQDGDLPNLVVGSVRSAPGAVEGTAVYWVTVGNTGQGDAKDFTVSLIADGAHIDTRTLTALKAGEFTTVRFTGPYCRRLRAVVDRGLSVPETVEEDNELRARC